jgi:hypothetical protein
VIQDQKINKKEIKSRLICEGICQSYTQGIWHVEVVIMSRVSQREKVNVKCGSALCI